jgi:hypothetical protein
MGNWRSDVSRSWATMKRGWTAGRQSKALGLPLNRRLSAHNVFEVPVDPSVVDAGYRLYRRHIAPRIADQQGAFRSEDDLAFFVKRPEGWSSDISWWSADNPSTHHLFEREFFRKILFDEAFLRLIDVTWPCGCTVHSLSSAAGASRRYSTAIISGGPAQTATP